MKYLAKSLIVSAIAVVALFLLCTTINLVPSVLALTITVLTSFAMVGLDIVTN